MTGRDYSLYKIIQLFETLGLSFIEMTSQIKKGLSEETFMLTEKQETFFAQNLDYYFFYHKIFKDYVSLKEVKGLMKLSESRYWKMVKKLEEFKLIELHSENKVVLKVKKGITLRPDGELQRTLLSKIGEGFNQYLFDDEFEKKNPQFPLKYQGKYNSPYMRLYFGKIHPHHYRDLQEKLKEIHGEFVQSCIADRKYYSQKQLIDVSWLQGLGVINGIDFLYFDKE